MFLMSISETLATTDLIGRKSWMPERFNFDSDLEVQDCADTMLDSISKIDSKPNTLFMLKVIITHYECRNHILQIKIYSCLSIN